MMIARLRRQPRRLLARPFAPDFIKAGVRIVPVPCAEGLPVNRGNVDDAPRETLSAAVATTTQELADAGALELEDMLS